MSETNPFERPQQAPASSSPPPAGTQPLPRQPLPRQPQPGQPYPGQAYQGQAYPGQPYPGQPYAAAYPLAPGQPGPGQPMRAPRRGWRPLALTGLAGAIAGAVLSAAVAVPVTLTLADDDSVVSSVEDGSTDGSSGTTDGSTDGGTVPDPGTYGQAPYDSLPGSGYQSSSGTEATDDQSVGVVLIESTLDGGAGAGTGMVLSEDGLVLTNYHVVEDSTSLQVTIASDGATYDAEVVGADETADVALLQLDGASDLDTVPLDDDGDDVVGTEVTAVGNAQGQGYLSAVTGQVTSTEQSITTSDGMGVGASDAELTGLLETDAPVVSGYSGGPMLDAEGEVVGISTAASTGVAQSYAVPIEDALAITDRIEDGDESGTVRVGPGAYLGIGAQAGNGGVTIAQVEQGGAAAGAGLVAGDTLTAIDGTAVTSVSDLTGLLATHEPGEEVELTWTSAAGGRQSATVTLDESPVN